MPKGSVIGKAIPASSGEWRDPEIFGSLCARVAAEERRGKEAQTGRVKRRLRNAVMSGNWICMKARWFHHCSVRDNGL